MSRSKVKMLKRLLGESLDLIDLMKNDSVVLEENLKLDLELKEAKEEIEKLSKEVIFHAKDAYSSKENSKILIDELQGRVENLQRENLDLKADVVKTIAKNENKFFKGNVIRELREIIKSY